MFLKTQNYVREVCMEIVLSRSLLYYSEEDVSDGGERGEW